MPSVVAKWRVPARVKKGLGQLTAGCSHLGAAVDSYGFSSTAARQGVCGKVWPYVLDRVCR